MYLCDIELSETHRKNNKLKYKHIDNEIELTNAQVELQRLCNNNTPSKKPNNIVKI
jgi:hypothetical protein